MMLPGDRAAVETLAFIVPKRIEIKPFLRAVGRTDRLRFGSFAAWQFELLGRRCVLLECGIGAGCAARGTEALLETVRPVFLVTFGVAGAASRGMRVGDVVALRSVRELSAGALGEAAPLGSWSSRALDEAAAVLARTGAQLHTGTAVTTQGEQSVPAGADAESCTVLEMETAAIKSAADRFGVPVLGMRSISDSPDEPLPFDLAKVIDAGGRVKVAKIVAGILSRPGLIRELARTSRNTVTAAQNLAAALIAALSAQLTRSAP